MEWRRLSPTGVILLLVGLALLAVLTVDGYAQAELDSTRLAEKGKGIFQQKCSPCHAIGEDRPTGPDLAGVTERRDRQWLIRMIQEPERLIAEKDPAALELLEKLNNLQMPASDLSDSDLEAVLAYLSAPAEEEHHPPAAPTAAPPAGDPEEGRALYTGASHFAKGGAPCLACHGIAGLGPGGGASYGPDLTSMYGNYGPEGVASILEGLPFPTMEPIYADRPLTPEERAHLTSYLAQVSGPELAGTTGRFALHAMIATAVLLAAAAVFGWRRLRGVRRPLVEQATKRQG